MFCISPIFSQFVFPDDESTILYNIPRNVGIIGYSFIAYQLPVKRIFSIPLKWLVPIFTVLVLLIGLFLGRVIANLLINRIKVIHRAIQMYSFGDSINIESTYNDEITDISQAINDLVALVNIHIDKTKHVNDQLTKRLEEQRVELESVNIELKDANLMQRVIVAHAIQEIQQITSC